MAPLRRLIAQRHLAGWLCAVALLLKLVIPTGFMVASDGARVTVTLCSGMAPSMPMAGMHRRMAGHDHHDQGKTDLPCAFGGLAGHALAAADPILLVALVTFIVATARLLVRLPAPVRRTYLRPPLRGPPARP